MQANWMPICAGPWAIFDIGENSKDENGKENILSEMALIAKGFLVFVVVRTEGVDFTIQQVQSLYVVVE